MKYIQLVFATVLAIVSESIQSQQDNSDWDIDFQSFALGTYTARIGSDWPQTPEGSRFLLAEERLRLELNMWTDFAGTEIMVRLDGVHDWVTNDFSLDLREAYLDFTTGKADFRFGRQIATWGGSVICFSSTMFFRRTGYHFSQEGRSNTLRPGSMPCVAAIPQSC